MITTKKEYKAIEGTLERLNKINLLIIDYCDFSSNNGDIVEDLIKECEDIIEQCYCPGADASKLMIAKLKMFVLKAKREMDKIEEGWRL